MRKRCRTTPTTRRNDDATLALGGTQFGLSGDLNDTTNTTTNIIIGWIQTNNY